MKHLGLKSLTMGLAAVLAFTTAPFEADAQERASRSARSRAQAAQAGPQLDRERGGREAPAAVTAARLACTVADAAFVGASVASVNGAQVTRNAYEVACQEGLGYILFQPQGGGGAVEAHDCLVVDASYRAAQAQGPAPTALQCRLPANAQPAQGLRNVVAQAGGRCTVSGARYIGELAQARMLRYEVTCSEGPGFVLDRPLAAGTAPRLTNCLALAGTTNACTLTSQAQLLAALSPVVAQSQRPCTVNNARMAGLNPTTGAEVLEIGCASSPGFFVELNNTGQFVRAIDCGRVANQQCQFTSAEAAQASVRSDVERRLRAAGTDCTVGEFRAVGAERETGREIYEVTCTNREGGAIAILASASTPRNEFHDCLAAPRWGTTCQLTRESLAYPAVQRAMVIRNRNPGCSISNARWMGRTDQGENWFEVTCADGRAFVVDYRGNGRVATTLTCRDAANIGGGCRAGVRGSVPKD